MQSPNLFEKWVHQSILYVCLDDTMKQGPPLLDDIFFSNFHSDNGVHQGCMSSPIVFNIYRELKMRISLEIWRAGVAIGGQKISNLRCVDYATLFTTTIH